MEDNPFQSPQTVGPEGALAGNPRELGKARQVRLVAVLMIVQGALLMLGGVGLMVMAVVFAPKLAAQVNQQQGGNAAQLPPGTMELIFQATYGGLGTVLLASGVLNVWAGLRNYAFRSRTLGIVALISGLSSVFTCYCVPFSLALMIYGLIIYLSLDAERAFRAQEAPPIA